MPVPEFRLNRFERILFRIVIVLAAVIVAVRVGAIAGLWLVSESSWPGHHRPVAVPAWLFQIAGSAVAPQIS